MPTEEKLLLKPMVHQARSYQWLVVPLAGRGVNRHLIRGGQNSESWWTVCLWDRPQINVYSRSLCLGIVVSLSPELLLLTFCCCNKYKVDLLSSYILQYFGDEGG